jgi:adenosylcobinamide-GDP ribazoletransferase
VRSIYSNSIVWFNACIAAFQLLSTLYVPKKIAYTEAVNRRSVVFYPWVGASIGLLLFMAAWGFSIFLPGTVAGVCLLIIWVILTGALHLDGLLDTTDGLLSRQPREKMLEIMKDSRIGAMGAVVCVLYLLLKGSLLISLFSHKEPLVGLVMTAVIPIWSRWFMVWAITGWPYARAGQGMGTHLFQVGVRHAIIATAGAVSLTVAIMVFFNLMYNFTWLQLILIVFGFAVASGIAGWMMSIYLSRKLGGLTGDTYGAINEMLELILLFCVSAFVGYL